MCAFRCTHSCFKHLSSNIHKLAVCQDADGLCICVSHLHACLSELSATQQASCETDRSSYREEERSEREKESVLAHVCMFPVVRVIEFTI